MTDRGGAVRDLARLVRPPNLVIAAAGVFAGGWIALGRVATPAALWWAALAGVGVGAAGYVLNDLADAGADRVNRPARPIAGMAVLPERARVVVLPCALVGLAAAGMVSGVLLLVTAAALAVMVAYSPWLKPRGLPGNVAVAVVAGLPLWAGALAVGAGRAGLVPWALAGWLHLMREIVKDVEDEPGDRVIGRRTLPIALGSRPAEVVAAGVGLLFVPASLLLPYAAGFGPAYFLIALPAQMAVLVAATWLILGRVARVSTVLKSSMVVGLAALVAGRVA